MKKLFVYGSLMSGLDTEGLMSGAELVCGNSRTVSDYAMYIHEGYPFVFEGRSCCRIKGELYRVPQEMFGLLDGYEGDFYFRKLTEIETKGGVVTAFMYFGRGHFFGMKEVAGGDYRLFRGIK